MPPIVHALWVVAALTCLAFGMAEMARWLFMRTWQLNPKKLLTPALGTGSAFGIVGALISLPISLLQSAGEGPDPTTNEVIGTLILFLAVSYLGWIAMVSAHRHVKNWPIRDVVRTTIRAAGPAFLMTLCIVVLIVAFYKPL